MYYSSLRNISLFLWNHYYDIGIENYSPKQIETQHSKYIKNSGMRSSRVGQKSCVLSWAQLSR